ncbi:MAG: phosphatase PAP2 family protein [Polyangiaceae bacterium]|nr:phosphatase PAP2 family protein [Polyangiaceae bacterium]
MSASHVDGGAGNATLARTRLFYAGVSLAAYTLWFGTFFAVGRYAATLPTIDPTSALDRRIPLVVELVWIYELCYLMPFLALVILRDWHRFNVALVALAIANGAAFVVYLTVPIAFPRPALGTGWADRVLAFEYAADFQPGANKLPSMHVAIAWILACAMRGQHPRRAVGLALWLLAALISASTLFVKQHIVIDVAVGIPWGLGAWLLAKRLYPKLVDPALPPERALVQLVTLPWRRIRRLAGERAAR